jgi:hypothetical protein
MGKEFVWYGISTNELIILDEYDHWLIKNNNWMCWFFVGDL